MEEISTEQKLQLVQQIRSQYNRNRYDMNHREQILYGRTSSTAGLSQMNSYNKMSFQKEKLSTTEAEADVTLTSVSLKFRCALAALLFIFAVISDFFGIKPLGLEMQQIFTYIAADYREYVSDYVETLSSFLQ